jgi:hypothetical protein
MRPEDDIYVLPTEPGLEGYSLDGEDAVGRRVAEDDDSFGEAAIVQKPKKCCALGRDDRKSCRIRVSEDRRSCDLKFGAVVLPALLMDESRGGFAVLVDRLDGLKAGKKANLRTDAGWFKVRVIYIQEAVRSPFSDSKCECWYRLGLRKVRSFFLF